jgi:hypothetical protein
LFITIAQPLALIAVHFLISSVVLVILLWVWWFGQQRLQRRNQLEAAILPLVFAAGGLDSLGTCCLRFGLRLGGLILVRQFRVCIL